MLWSGWSERFNPGERFLAEGKTCSAIRNTMSRSVDSALLPVCLCSMLNALDNTVILRWTALGQLSQFFLAICYLFLQACSEP